MKNENENLETKKPSDVQTSELSDLLAGVLTNKKVKIISKKHPHYGETATFVRVVKTPIGIGMVFKGDYNEFFVFRGSEYQIL